LNVRSDERYSILVIISVDDQGYKELIALEDGYWGSTKSGLSLLRKLKG
jgi:hypothetical protein